MLGGAGLAAGITVGALLAQQMLGSDSLAGVPTTLFTLGSALAAYLVGRLTQRWGRRIGLGLGFAVGALGSLGVVVAGLLHNVPLLFASLFVYGAGSATNLQARYAGTDLAEPERRGMAISIAMVATTFGAVAGPNLVEPLGALATAIGIPALTGPFLLAGVADIAAGLTLLLLLRPDPFLLAKELETAEAAETPEALPATRPGVGAYVGATIMVLTQIAMIAIMTMTPIHMRAHDHGLSAIGLVIGLHVGSMFLPSLITGALVDRIGRVPMAVASGVTLLVAGVMAAVTPGESLGWLIAALMLLGLGWNLGVISGTALVVDSTDPAIRPRVQGTIDVLIAIGGATGGALSGVIVAASSYATLSLAGGVLSLLLIPVLLWTRTPRSARA